ELSVVVGAPAVDPTVLGEGTGVLEPDTDVDRLRGNRWLDGEGPMEEGCHLAAGDETVGTETVVGRRVTASGDPSRSQRIDVALERPRRIREPLIVGRRQAQWSEQGRRHLSPSA